MQHHSDDHCTSHSTGLQDIQLLFSIVKWSLLLRLSSGCCIMMLNCEIYIGACLLVSTAAMISS